MKRTLRVDTDDPIIVMADGIVYAERADWCDSTTRTLRLSIMRPRAYYDYDKREVRPVIVWLCGGGYTSMDRNVWAPELAWFTKHGYAVASLDYSVTARTRFPEQICDIKEGIRFLRRHSGRFGLDPERFAIMGESAGGYFSALAGVTGNTREYDAGANLDESSAVQAVVAWYPISEPSSYEVDEKFALMLPRDMKNYADVTQKAHAAAPPTLILHGNADVMVDISQGEKLHDSLEAAGAKVDMIILDGARHLDAPFIQPEIKRIILNFLDERLKNGWSNEKANSTL